MAGVCLVGTALIGPAAGRSIRVYNRGGLDWERPVFGQFGAFSGGMFGLFPVYCRAEGYDFDVIDKPEKPASDKALAGPGNGSKIASVMLAAAGGNPVFKSILEAGVKGVEALRKVDASGWIPIATGRCGVCGRRTRRQGDPGFHRAG